MWPPVMEQHSISRSRISCGELGELLAREALEVGGRLDGREQAHHRLGYVEVIPSVARDLARERRSMPARSLATLGMTSGSPADIRNSSKQYIRPRRPAPRSGPRPPPGARPPAGPAARPPPGRASTPSTLTYVDFASCGVPSRRLPQLLAGPGRVQDVVGDLEGEADVLPVLRQRGDLGRPPPRPRSRPGCRRHGSGLRSFPDAPRSGRPARARVLPPRGPATARPPSPGCRRRGTAPPPSGPARPAGGRARPPPSASTRAATGTSR